VLANAGASAHQLRQHLGHKSLGVATEYIDTSKSVQREVSERLAGEPGSAASSSSTTTSSSSASHTITYEQENTQNADAPNWCFGQYISHGATVTFNINIAGNQPNHIQ